MSLDLIQSIRTQSKLSISQAITLVENESELGAELLSNLYEYTGNAYRIGITGPPGAGKSSLTDELIFSFRKQKKKVAVIAIDPTSPFSGGSVLGDRIRMTKHHSDPGVYIRSMATRGSYGGLSNQADEIGDIFDAARFDIIIYETVGVGQVELDVIQTADSIIVLLVPESGDEVQLMKAGLMEIGSIFTINKSDRPGANKLGVTLKNLLSSMTFKENDWKVPVVSTIAIKGEGTDELMEYIIAHQKHIMSLGKYDKKFNERYKRRVEAYINLTLEEQFWDDGKREMIIRELNKNQQKRLSPQLLAKKLLLK